MSLTLLFVAAALTWPSDVAARRGGPDGAGYAYFDQDDGCSFDFVDLSSDPLASVVISGCDDCVGTVVLTQPFPFYDVDRTQLTVSSNGWISPNYFGTSDFSNDCPIPSTFSSNPQLRIMPYHDDIDLGNIPGTVYHRHFSVCPRAPGIACDVFHWHRTDYWQPAGSDFELEAILYVDGSMVFQKDGNDLRDGGSASIGIQASPTLGLQYSCGTNDSTPGFVIDPSAICIARGCEALAPGDSCSDGNPCTIDDVCDASLNCVGGGQLDDGTSCGGDDGNECTALPVCQAGTCVTENESDGADCSDGNQCTAESCYEGACVSEDLPTGTPCNDGNQCSEGGCDGGACVSNPRPDGSPCVADGNVCTDDFCQGGACITEDVMDGMPCGGGLGACDDSSECISGTCQTEGLDCSFQDSQCEVGACDPATGGCMPIAVVGGCDDGNPCTTVDSCLNGVCDGGVPVDCSGLDTACSVGACDPATGGCVSVPIADGSSCNDGNQCTKAACQGGACQATDLLDGTRCFLNFDCDEDQCVQGVCTEVGPIDCGGTECFPNGCAPGPMCFPLGPQVAGSPCAPSDPANPCIIGGQCDGGSTCLDVFVPPLTPCDDNNPCTITDVCAAGVCAGTPVADGMGCDDANVCTSGDQCIGGVCQGSANSLSCSDGTACTTGDTCMGGSCVGTATTCPGTDACNVGYCDPATGNCSTVFASAGTPCDDGDPCTVRDGCFDGTCTGRAKDCADKGSACGAPSCNPTTGECELDPINEGGLCNDGDPCTTGDSCTSGACTGAAKDCSSLTDSCNTGTCDAFTGQCRREPLADGTACDDGDACTGGDVCVGGLCDGPENLCAADFGSSNSGNSGRAPGSIKKNCANTGAQPWALVGIAGLLMLRRRRRR